MKKTERTNLISIKFDINKRYPLVAAGVMLDNSRKGLGHEVHYQIEINFIPGSSRVEAVLKRNNIGVIHQAH